MTTYQLQASYRGLLSSFLAAGYTVAAPVKVKGVTLFSIITDAGQALLPDEYIITTRSAKEFFFPQTEPVAQFTLEGKNVQVTGVPVKPVKMVIAGVRPCDAAAFNSIGHIFNYVYNDTLYTTRRENTVIVSVACADADASCFCTSFGLAPDSPGGADVFMIQDALGNWLLQAHTLRGEELMAAVPEPRLLTEAVQPAPFYAAVAEKIRPALDIPAIKNYLGVHFEDGPWQEFERCLGCASCAYLCPTCHCFDIVDREQYDKALRVKNWDACQFPVFTRHAGGHNPRGTQQKRYRQRLMHKFKYYDDRFNTHLCTGCGRCVRACPVNIDIYEAAANLMVQEA